MVEFIVSFVLSMLLQSGVHAVVATVTTPNQAVVTVDCGGDGPQRAKKVEEAMLQKHGKKVEVRCKSTSADEQQPSAAVATPAPAGSDNAP